MAGSSASLVVRISADLNDFTKGLNAATRDVDKAAKKIEGFGKALTLGITVPVLAAAAALAKMASENEDTAARMQRVFGSAATSVNASIQKMMSSVPEANTDLQKMAISVDNMAQGLGLAPGNAAKMSESLLKLAGDASAFAHVPMAEALDALSRGLAGKTRGLLQFGIAINEADIKAKALSMGLLHEGNELTETGTALASYALIMEKSARITGEAERTAGQAGKSFAFLKRDISELADNVSHLVLPALSDLANKARDVVNWTSKLDSSTVSAFFKIAAAAALLGPAIVIVVRMIDGLVKLRAAFVLLSTAGAGGAFASLAAMPFASMALGIGGVAAAILLAADAWKKYAESQGVASSKNLGIPSSVLGGGGSLLHTEHVPFLVTHEAPNEDQLKKFFGYKGEANGATERSKAADALKELEERASRAGEMVKRMGDAWNDAIGGEAILALAKVDAALSQIADKSSKQAIDLTNAYEGLAKVLGEITSHQNDIANLPSIMATGTAKVTPSSFNPGNLTSRIEGPTVADLPGFTAANLAALRYADSQDYITERNAVAFQGLRQGLDQFGIHLKNVGERAQGAINILADGFLQLGMQLVANFGGKGPAAGTGRQLGGLGGAALGFFLGGPVGAIAGSIVGTGLGGLIGGIFDHPKKEADTAANSMNALAKTVDRVNASISNMPQWFKIAGFRFAAANPVVPAPPPPAYTPPTPNAPTGGTPIDGGTELPGANTARFHIEHLTVQSTATNVRQLLAEIEKAAFEKQATGAASGFAFAFQGT